MTIYSSKTPRDLNRDRALRVVAHPFKLQHNEPNPILTEFRHVHSGTGNLLRVDALLFASELFERYEEFPEDQMNHALDVLIRLARLTRIANLGKVEA